MIKNRFVSKYLCLAALFFAQVSFSAPVLYNSSDVTKSGSPFHLGISGLGTFELKTPGVFSYDETAGFVNYSASVVSSTGVDGFDIDLHLKEIPSHAPRCYEFDCSGTYYTFGGIDPATDWSFFEVDAAKTSLLSGFGSLSGVVLEIMGDKWFQFGNGAGGAKVIPEELQFSGWFGLKNLADGTSSNGDINGNLVVVSEPGLLPLLSFALMGLMAVRRKQS